MKKIIYTIGILMLCSGLIKPLIGSAADPNAQSPGSDSCDAVVDASCLRKSIKGLDWGQSFGETDASKVGQDLYETIYYKMKYNPLDEAINQTAAQYGIPPERMSLILVGDISPILEQRPTITIESAQGIFRTMQATYVRNKREADLNANLKVATEPAEIFANGDINDSGFDLINDLNNIEIILFKKNDLVTFGGAYSPAGGTSSGSNGTPATPNLNTPGIGTATGSGSSGNANGSGSATGNGSGTAIPNPANPIIGSSTGEINPNICFVGDDLKKALDALEKSKQQQTGNASGNNTGAGNGAGTGASTQSSGNGGAGITGQGTQSNQTNQSNTQPSSEVQPAPAGDYQKNPLCGQIFCLTIDFVSAPVKPAFAETDNCIDCHIQYINDKLQKTLAHDLTPSKAPGNFGETSMCKSAAGIALGNIGLNVAFQPVPIVTPVKDDLMTLSSTNDQWNQFWANNAFWNYSETERKRISADFNNLNYQTSSLEENITQQVLNSVPDNASISSVSDQIANTAYQITSQQNITSLQGDVGSPAYQEAETQNDLAVEMRTMNSYFGNIRNVIRSLSSIVPGMNSSLACQKLKNKKACT